MIIVVQVAIIRPGPIVGQMMHPYMRRRQHKEAVSYPHPSLEPVLKRTLGVPLFQEQLLRMAMVVANFSGAEAEELRRAVGMRRSWERMKNLEGKLRIRHDCERAGCYDAKQHHSKYQLVCAVWISRITRCKLRTDRLCLRLLSK